MLEDHLDSRIAQLDEVVALPVVARAGRQQRVEGRLPAGERLRAHDVGDRFAERAQRRHGLFALFQIAGVAEGKDEHLAAVPLFGRNGSGGALRITTQQVSSSGALATIRR